MPDQLIPTAETPEALRARAVTNVAGNLARHSRLLADNLSCAIGQAEARHDEAALPGMRAEMEALLDFEQHLTKCAVARPAMCATSAS